MRLVLFLLACLAGNLAFPAAAAGPAPIRVGVIGPFSGGSSPMGLSMRNGVRMAVEEINWKGGVLGRTIELVERDDEASPDKGTLAALDFAGKDKVVAVLGFINTGVALKAQKPLQEARIPVITNVSSGAAVTRQFLPPQYPENYIFRNAASDAIQTEMAVREAVERRGYRKIAIFSDTTPYGQQGAYLMKKALTERALAPVVEEEFKVGDLAMAAQLERARKAGAEVLLCWGIGPELAAIANGAAKMGWKVPMVGGWTLSLDNFIAAAGRNGNGARMPQTFIEEPTTSRHTSFITTYLNTHNVKRIPSAVSAAQGYDSVLLLAAALEQAGTTEGPRLREALESLDRKVYGVVTTYQRPYSRDDHEAITQNMVVTGEVRNGVVTYAYREDEKAAIVGRKRAK